MTAARDQPSLPPADWAERDFTSHLVPFTGRMFRLAHEYAPRVDWSDSAAARFSHPSLPCQVLYLGPRKETCFWERFGPEIRDQGLTTRAIARKALAERVWKTFVIEPRHELRCLDLTRSDTLRALGADGATFAGPYAVTQAWAGALMTHPSRIEAVIYESRLDKPQRCLAVFQQPRWGAGQETFGATIEPVRPLADPELLAVLVQERIAVIAPL